MLRTALLDVNVLVALFDPDHVHHDAAHDWFAANRAGGWATCPLTENGLVRILSNVAYSPVHESAAEILRRLMMLCAGGDHVFWGDKISLRDERFFKAALPISHRQVTDVYLLGLAKSHDGRLATFDRTIPITAVVDAGRDDLAVIPA